MRFLGDGLICANVGIMANLFPKYLSDYVTDKLRSAGVDVVTGRMVKEISNTDGKVNIKLDNDQTVAADHLSTCVAPI